MPKSPERVALTHPGLPGQVLYVHPRGVPARRRSGWVDASTSPAREAATKSPPAAKAVDETPTSPEGDAATPSEEES